MKTPQLIVISLLLTVIATVSAQRGSYAGGRPQGYKDKYTPQTADVISNRFGEENKLAATGQKLPVAAHGDAQLVQHLNNIPYEKRPFWFINYQAIEAQQQQPFPIVQPVQGAVPFAQGR